MAIPLALVAGYVLRSHLIQAVPSDLFCVSNRESASITTLNASAPHATCFRVHDGLFSEILPETAQPSPGEEVTYLDGWVLPGIIESHGHLLQYGEMLESVSLYGAESIEEIRARTKDFLNAHPEEGYGARDKWIRGVGWDQKYFGGVMPTAVGPSLSLLRCSAG